MKFVLKRPSTLNIVTNFQFVLNIDFNDKIERPRWFNLCDLNYVIYINVGGRINASNRSYHYQIYALERIIARYLIRTIGSW